MTAPIVALTLCLGSPLLTVLLLFVGGDPPSSAPLQLVILGLLPIGGMAGLVAALIARRKAARGHLAAAVGSSLFLAAAAFAWVNAAMILFVAVPTEQQARAHVAPLVDAWRRGDSVAVGRLIGHPLRTPGEWAECVRRWGAPTRTLSVEYVPEPRYFIDGLQGFVVASIAFEHKERAAFRWHLESDAPPLSRPPRVSMTQLAMMDPRCD